MSEDNELFAASDDFLDRTVWEKETGEKTGNSTLPNRYSRLKSNFVVIEEAEEHKRMFEVECRGKKSLFFKKWPQAFRWTCCGTDAGMNYGCDHHGSGSRPCTCDFCQ